MIPLMLRYAGNRRRPAPGTEIFYDRDLPRRLAERHQRLAELAAQMRISAREGAYTHTEVLLEQFARIRREQVLERNVKLYAYARACLRDDEVKGERLLTMRRALSRHTRVTGDFVRKYLYCGVGPHNAERFCEDVERLNAAVGKHEVYGTLYFVPLYKSLRSGARALRPSTNHFLGIRPAEA